jgi:hypothetical protein
MAIAKASQQPVVAPPRAMESGMDVLSRTWLLRESSRAGGQACSEAARARALRTQLQRGGSRLSSAPRPWGRLESASRCVPPGGGGDVFDSLNLWTRGHGAYLMFWCSGMCKCAATDQRLVTRLPEGQRLRRAAHSAKTSVSKRWNLSSERHGTIPLEQLNNI